MVTLRGHLRHPHLIGMRCYPCDVNLSAAQVDEEQHIVGDQATPRPDLGGEEIGGHQHIHVGADERLPCGRLLPLWRWNNAMAFQDVPDRLVADGVPQMRQRTGNAIIAPGAVFLGHANHQSL